MTGTLDESSGLSLSASRTAHFEFLHRSCLDLVKSSAVEEFCIGISAKPFSRRRAYSRWCRQIGAELHGFMVLDWGRSAQQVLDCERWLFHRLDGHRKYSRTTTRRYYPSASRKLDEQMIYLAWWSWP
jgi:hypothetical protein